MYGALDPLPPLETDGLLMSRPSKPQRAVTTTQWMALGMAGTAMVLAAALMCAQRLDNSPTARGSRRLGSRNGAHTMSKPVNTSSLYRRWSARQRMDVSAPIMTLSFEVENRYGKHMTMDTEYPWLNGTKLIEPHMETVLKILKPIKGVSYVWRLYQGDLLIEQYAGNVVNITLATPGTYEMHVQAVGGDKASLGLSQETVYCKYVRRELRSLLEEDRDAFMDAAHTIWTVATEEGQQIYGSNYRDIHYFAGYHLLQAAEMHCDHMHDGLGFLTQHAALTMKFEQVLRTINPALSMPYWDFTIDVEQLNRDKDGNYSQYWFDTEVFSDDYFGRVDAAEHTVTTGRWAYTEISQSPFEIKNAYGLMRAPWNCNKSKYVTRYSTFCGQDWTWQDYVMPACEAHYNIIAGFNTWREFGHELALAPHGAIHSATGGSFNCEASRQGMRDLGLDDDFVLFYSLWSFGYQRKFYRQGVLTCPTNCTDSTVQDDCICTCDIDDLLNTFGDMDTLLRELVNDPDYRSSVTALSEEGQRSFVDLVCKSGVLVGDHIEAASPYDISFWPIHPALDRLWQAKKLWGMLSDETWEGGSSSYGSTCGGHDSNSTIPIAGLFTDPEVYYTNGELLAAMDPSSDSLPYIYDDFTWSHCREYAQLDFHNMTRGVILGEEHEENNSDTSKRRRR